MEFSWEMSVSTARAWAWEVDGDIVNSCAKGKMLLLGVYLEFK